MSDQNAQRKISRDEALERIAALKKKLPTESPGRGTSAASCSNCSGCSPCSACSKCSPPCPEKCKGATGPTGVTGATGAAGDCDIEHKLIEVDDYLKLSPEERRRADIQWIIYPNGYL